MDKPSDEIIKGWRELAQTRLDEGHPADPAALSTIITLCDIVLTERHGGREHWINPNLLHHENLYKEKDPNG